MLESLEIYACLKWVDPVDQPSKIDDLPPDFTVAKDLWAQSGEANGRKVFQLLQQYLGAVFLPECVDKNGEVFLRPVTGEELQVPAYDIKLTGVDFTHGVIPRIKMEARFRVPLRGGYQTAAKAVVNWLKRPLSDAVSGFWVVPRTSATEELDFSMGDNQGVECIAVRRQ